MTYYFGHVNPWWYDSFKLYDYQYLPHKDSAMVNTWHAQGYQNLNLNGAIYNLKDSDYAQPFLNIFNWDNAGAALYRMNTGDILPVHQDHYITYQRVFDIKDTKQIWRSIVFMENWSSGHYFEIDGKPFTKWCAGDYVAWNYDVPHMAANIGLTPRYTMQITGTKC